jgi:GNAT superfamily N-acetyltransferase
MPGVRGEVGDPLHVLDNPAWSALTGPQAAMGQVAGAVARYEPQVSPFGAFAGVPGPADWSAMADLVGPGSAVITTGCTGTPPDGWTVEYDGVGVQLTGEGLAPDPSVGAAGDEVLELGAADADDMLDLVALARPGPFAPRTWTLGGYVGIRRHGRLVAMAGERMRPVGWAEISAVATHPEFRRQGLGRRLVEVVAAGIVARGEVPILHAAADNVGAIRLYEAMGFRIRRRTRFVAARAPGAPPVDGPPLTTPPQG